MTLRIMPVGISLDDLQELQDELRQYDNDVRWYHCNNEGQIDGIIRQVNQTPELDAVIFSHRIRSWYAADSDDSLERWVQETQHGALSPIQFPARLRVVHMPRRTGDHRRYSTEATSIADAARRLAYDIEEIPV